MFYFSHVVHVYCTRVTKIIIPLPMLISWWSVVSNITNKIWEVYVSFLMKRTTLFYRYVFFLSNVALNFTRELSIWWRFYGPLVFNSMKLVHIRRHQAIKWMPYNHKLEVMFESVVYLLHGIVPQCSIPTMDDIVNPRLRPTFYSQILKILVS